MTKINFIGNCKKFFVFSIILMVAALACALVFGVNLDIQFRGGSIIIYSYVGEIEASEVEDTFETLIGTRVTVQKSENIATGEQTVVISLPGTRSLDADEMVEVNEGMHARFPESNLQTVEISNVDPTIGKEFLAKCLTAVGVASLLMVLYVAWRFRKIGGLSAGAMGVVALVHDVIIVFGVFIVAGFTINDNFIAVVLTILGYSLNDTIVIYDRVRENERIYGREKSVGEIVNLSINQSFKRSLMTTITTVLAMIVVSVVAVIYNVNSILTFSLPLVVGLASGSYSSICLAGPLWVKWQERKMGQSGKPGPAKPVEPTV